MRMLAGGQVIEAIDAYTEVHDMTVVFVGYNKQGQPSLRHVYKVMSKLDNSILVDTSYITGITPQSDNDRSLNNSV